MDNQNLFKNQMKSNKLKKRFIKIYKIYIYKETILLQKYRMIK